MYTIGPVFSACMARSEVTNFLFTLLSNSNLVRASHMTSMVMIVPRFPAGPQELRQGGKDGLKKLCVSGGEGLERELIG